MKNEKSKQMIIFAGWLSTLMLDNKIYPAKISENKKINKAYNDGYNEALKDVHESIIGRKGKNKCVICGEKLNDEWGNNAEPIKRGRCCDYCNTTVVVPARIKRLTKKKKML